MPVQQNIELQVFRTNNQPSGNQRESAPVQDYEINVHVVDGWAITGHYQNNTLHTVTLQKTIESEEN